MSNFIFFGSRELNVRLPESTGTIRRKEPIIQQLPGSPYLVLSISINQVLDGPASTNQLTKERFKRLPTEVMVWSERRL